MHGILPLWKEKGMTSHDCVFKVRKILHTKKVGHTGTLDPTVEGVLPICIGNATRLAEYLTNAGKTYEAVIEIGVSTTTEDAEGEIVEEDLSEKQISRNELLQALQSLTGTINQTPPMYSAVKVNGKKLYEYARRGETVERPTRQVTIYELELLDHSTEYKGEKIRFAVRISCSKGTYIRTLAVQIGEALGYPAHMASLVRIKSGTFTKDDCVTLSELQEKVDAGLLQECMKPLEFALYEYPQIELTESIEKSVKNGQVLLMHPALNENDKIVYMKDNSAVAVYIKHPEKDGFMKPEKMFPNVD
ncbi:tRNA pseudouridine(55) synthase TruB [Rummeliibacillus sp. BSL5]